jgi:hypothetical protein
MLLIETRVIASFSIESAMPERCTRQLRACYHPTIDISYIKRWNGGIFYQNWRSYYMPLEWNILLKTSGIYQHSTYSMPFYIRTVVRFQLLVAQVTLATFCG